MIAAGQIQEPGFGCTSMSRIEDFGTHKHGGLLNQANRSQFIQVE